MLLQKVLKKKVIQLQDLIELLYAFCEFEGYFRKLNSFKFFSKKFCFPFLFFACKSCSSCRNPQPHYRFELAVLLFPGNSEFCQHVPGIINQHVQMEFIVFPSIPHLLFFPAMKSISPGIVPDACLSHVPLSSAWSLSILLIPRRTPGIPPP